MNIKARKPRRTRFEADSNAARLARLKESAPSLAGGSRLPLYAVLLSSLMVLTVAGLYLALQISQRMAEQRTDPARIEVLPADTTGISSREALIQQAIEVETAEDAHFREQLEALQAVDLLAPMDAGP